MIKSQLIDPVHKLPHDFSGLREATHPILQWCKRLCFLTHNSSCACVVYCNFGELVQNTKRICLLAKAYFVFVIHDSRTSCIDETLIKASVYHDKCGTNRKEVRTLPIFHELWLLCLRRRLSVSSSESHCVSKLPVFFSKWTTTTKWTNFSAG